MKKMILGLLALTGAAQLSQAQTAWDTNGNVLTDTTTEYLGTSTAQPFVLKTNAVERLRIRPNGAFRFGGGSFTNPKYSFNGAESEVFTISDYRHLHVIFDPVVPYDIFKIQSVDESILPMSAINLFKVDYRGYVAIGLENPQAKLHVHGGLIRVSGNNSSGGPMIVLGGTATSAGGDWGMEYGSSTSVPSLKGLNFWKPSGSVNAGNYFLFLADNGNVGIGTDNPGTFKLAVEGKIGAREIQVTNNSPWPDYVFEKSYARMNLADLEAYINANKHLPGIPSAAEVQAAGGIEIGAMQQKQMEKIEELYLYVIELKKENQELRQMVLELQQQ